VYPNGVLGAMRKYRKAAISLILLSVIAFNPLYAQKAEWVTGEAEILVQNISPDEAEKKAIDDARRNALLKKNAQVTNFLSVFETSESERTRAAQYTNLLSSGIIIDAKVPLITKILVPVEGEELLKINASVEVCISEIIGEPDPNFQVELDLNQDTFKEEDEIICRIRSTKDAYVTVINLASDGKIYFLLPSGFRKSTFIEKNSWNELPNDQERKRIQLYAYLPDKINMSSEIIMVIATKIPNEVIATPKRAGEMIIMTWEEMVRKMGRWLASLPRDQKTEDFVQYNIIK